MAVGDGGGRAPRRQLVLGVDIGKRTADQPMALLGMEVPDRLCSRHQAPSHRGASGSSSRLSKEKLRRLWHPGLIGLADAIPPGARFTHAAAALSCTTPARDGASRTSRAHRSSAAKGAHSQGLPKANGRATYGRDCPAGAVGRTLA